MRAARRHGCARGRGGFTLIEVMVSLAVTGALLVTLLYTLSANLGAAARHEASVRAVLLAKEKLREAEIDQVDSSGRFAGRDSAFGYEVRAAASAHEGLVVLSVAVSGEGEGVTLHELVPTRRAR